MLLYINFCFYFDTRNLSSNDIIYLTRVSLPLTSSRRGWSRYIDIQRLVNIFSDRNSSTGCFVTLRFPFFFFFYWPRYVPEIGVPFIEGKIKDILCGWGKNFALIHWSNRHFSFDEKKNRLEFSSRFIDPIFSTDYPQTHLQFLWSLINLEHRSQYTQQC